MNLDRAFLRVLVIAASSSICATAAAQSAAFMCASGIPGSSADERFAGCSDIVGVSYSVGIEGGVPPPRGTGGGTSQSTCGLYEVTKTIDASSIPLMLQSLLGQLSPEVAFSVRRQGEVPTVFYELVLRNVLIVEVQQNVATDSGLPVEKIVLQPGEVSWRFTPQAPTGLAGSPVEGGFDCIRNARL